MAIPVQGTTSTGGAPKSAPVVLAGIDGDGKVRPLAVSNTGVVSIAGSAAPSGNAGGVLDGTYPNPGLAAAVAGAGLLETSNVLSVVVDDSTIEINVDTLRLKAGAAAANLGSAGGDLTGTYPNPTVASNKITLAKMIGTFAYLLVQTGVPTTLTSPIVYDDTAVTGGLYIWNGTAYVKVAGLAP